MTGTAHDVRRMIEVQTHSLGAVLHAGVAASLTAAQRRLDGLEHFEYPHLVPSLLRAELREFYKINPLINGWALGGDSRQSGQLLLVNHELGLTMRFLKGRQSYPGGVPVAGSNKARQQVWERPMPIPNLVIPGLEEEVGPPEVQVLLLWDFAGNRTDEFVLKVVHPIEAGTYGKAVKCDLILDVGAEGEIFKTLEFAGSPEDDDLFVVDVQQEENESGA